MKEVVFKGKNIGVFVLFFIVGVVVYSPSLTGTFIFDDVHVLSDAKRLGSIPNYFKEVRKSRKFFSNRDSYAFWVIFLTEYNVFGHNPLGYKLVNLFFHILAAFVFFLFLKRILVIKFANSKSRQKEWLFYFPVIGGLMFLVHPLNTEAVSYISGMNNGIGGFFFILGAWLFVLFVGENSFSRKYIFLTTSIISFIIAFFIKEVYFVFPLFIAILYLVLKPFDKKRLYIVLLIVFVFGLITFLGVIFLPISPFPIIKSAFLRFTLDIKALATNLYAVAYSLYLSVFPKSLNIDHNLPLIGKIYDWRVVLAFLIIIAVIYLLFKFRDKLPFSLFAFISYLLLIAPTNSFILRGLKWTGYDILSERNLYAPMFFFSIILAELLWLFSGRDLKKFKSIAAIVIVLLACRTFARNFDFRNDLTVWKASLKYSKERVRPNYNYAVALKDRGRFEEAIPYAQKAYRLSPSENTVGLLATLYKKTGRTESYVTLLESALEKKELQTPTLYHEFGEYYYEKGEFGKAEKYLLKALEKKRGFVLPRISLVYMYLNEGRFNDAYKHLKVLKRLIKKYKYSFLAGVYIDETIMARVVFADALYDFAMNNAEKGVKKCLSAIKLNPMFTEPYLKLGEYYYVNKNDKKALYYFIKAKSTPDYEKYRTQVEDMIRKIKQNGE